MLKKIILFLLIFFFGFFLFSSFSFAASKVAPCKTGTISGEINCGQNSIFNLDPQKYSLPIILMAGTIDGINPCAIGMMILLLGYLIVFAKKQNQVFKIGLIYILAVFLTYFLIGLFFYKFVAALVSLPHYRNFSHLFRYLLAGLLILAGIINIKDFFWYGKGISLQVPHKTRFLLTRFVQKGTVPATIILGILVTIFELPCSLPLYVGAVTLMYQYLGVARTLFYLGVYNLMFVMPLVIIFILILSGSRVFELKEWQEANERKMKLVMGISLVTLSLILIFLTK